MSATPPAGAMRLLGIGVRSTRRSAALWAMGAGFEAGMGAVRVAFALLVSGMTADAFLRAAAAAGPGAPPERFVLLGLDGVLADRVVFPLVGLTVVVELLSATLRTFYLGASVEQLAALAATGKARSSGLVAEGAAAMARATVASIWLALIELGAGLWRWVVLAGAALMVRAAFTLREHRGRAALVAAVAVTLVSLAALLLALFGRVYLVRAIRGPTSTLAAVGEAIGLVRERTLTYLGLLIAEGVLLFLTLSFASAPDAMFAMLAPTSAAVQVVSRLLGAVVTGAVVAAIELMILGALCGADLDACGELPPPPAPPAPPPPREPVYAAQEVLVAQAVPEPPPEPAT